MSNKKNISIGIDVSKETLDISYGGQFIKIENNQKAIDSFIKNKLQGAIPQLCVIESTGGYENTVRKRLQHFSLPVHTGHPNRVYHFLQSQHYAKTDKIDAKGLEKYAAYLGSKARLDEPVTAQQEALEALRLVQKMLEKDLHGSQCRLHHIKPKSEASKILKRHIISMKRQLDRIHSELQSMIEKDSALKARKRLLTSFKGVGEKVAHVLMCECPELGKLSKQEIASLIGLAPRTRSSGKKVFHGKIQGGRFFVRKALYMSALVAIRFNPPLKAFYEGLIARGKLFKVAIVAVMRKIIVTLNAMVKNNRVYAG